MGSIRLFVGGGDHANLVARFPSIRGVDEASGDVAALHIGENLAHIGAVDEEAVFEPMSASFSVVGVCTA